LLHGRVVIWIDPEKNGGEVTIKIERAVYADTSEGDHYLHCRPEYGNRRQ